MEIVRGMAGVLTSGRGCGGVGAGAWASVGPFPLKVAGRPADRNRFFPIPLPPERGSGARKDGGSADSMVKNAPAILLAAALAFSKKSKKSRASSVDGSVPQVNRPGGNVRNILMEIAVADSFIPPQEGTSSYWHQLFPTEDARRRSPGVLLFFPSLSLRWKALLQASLRPVASFCCNPWAAAVRWNRLIGCTVALRPRRNRS
ncbi:MAG TPA: hypothetical protein VMS17_16005 [Gemmataceae bacterium]|nr:hypothetical protein [Gemmataceae bacterium]